MKKMLSMRNPNGVRHLSQVWILLGPWLLVSCAAPSPLVNPAGPASAPPSTPATVNATVETKLPKSITWIDRVRRTGAVELDKIDPELLAEPAQFDIQSQVEFSQDCKLEVQYPQISGLADPTWQTQINESLRQEIMEQVGASKPMSADNQCPNGPKRTDEYYTRADKCVVHFAKKRLVSLSCPTHTFPATNLEFIEHPITFDLVTGEIYQLTDLFKANSSYRINLAVAMRDALWEAKIPQPLMINFPFEKLEAKSSFNYYLQQSCNKVFYDQNETSLLGGFPTVCMVIPNLGSGATRNYKMVVRLNSLKAMIEPSQTLKILSESIK
jgi:hypothetical protein